MAARSTALWAVEPETYIDQGLAKAEAGNHAGAIEDFSRAIKLNPSLPMAYLARAQSRVAKAEYRDAIKDYSRAIRLNNANAAAYLNRGQAHGMLKEYQAELDDSSQAIKIAPGYAEAYVNRGVAKTKLHDPDPAAHKGASDRPRAIKHHYHFRHLFFLPGRERIRGEALREGWFRFGWK